MSSGWKWSFRIGFMIVVLTLVGAAVFVVGGRWQAMKQGYSDLVKGGSIDLSAAQHFYLQTYLSSKTVELGQPAGSGSQPVNFVVNPGESANMIASNLAAQGVLENTELFLKYAQFQGIDAGLEAGEYVLSPQWTIPELAAALTESRAKEIELRMLEGWRLEEIAAYLEAVSPADIDASQFRSIALRQTGFEAQPYDFLASLPADASLEGFLFPDTYRVPLDADAGYLIEQMLQNFGRRVTPAMRQAFGANGLSLQQAVTLASIVEREAVIHSERPVIASVFYNRLAQGMRLEADPTTQYAVGYQPETDSWWKSPLYYDDLQIDSPYNTYVAPGLPPGPIANPGLSSLEAVAMPVESNYLFFVADCHAEVAGSHLFSVTYEEHLARVQLCR